MNIHELTVTDLAVLTAELDAKPHRLEEAAVINDMQGCTPLIGACSNKANLKIVEFLVGRGANVNARTMVRDRLHKFPSSCDSMIQCE
jgi:hypothetical protein